MGKGKGGGLIIGVLVKRVVWGDETVRSTTDVPKAFKSGNLVDDYTMFMSLDNAMYSTSRARGAPAASLIAH